VDPADSGRDDTADDAVAVPIKVTKSGAADDVPRASSAAEPVTIPVSVPGAAEAADAPAADKPEQPEPEEPPLPEMSPVQSEPKDSEPEAATPLDPPPVAQPPAVEPDTTAPADRPVAIPAAPAGVSAPPLAPIKKKTLRPVAALLLFLGAGLLAGAGFVGYNLLTRLDLSPYENQDMKFAIDQPTGWESSVINQPTLRQVAFSEPASKEADSYTAQMVVRYDHNEEVEEVGEQQFFERVEQAVKYTIDHQSADAAAEKAIVTRQERQQYAGKPALRLSFEIANLGGKTGERGFGEVVFVYVDGHTSYTIAIDGTSSDRGLDRRAEDILRSFRVI
jgi:outer membrane biosynthesis protein TonB